jgi:nicotinate-nucleotide adenylyltransferase
LINALPTAYPGLRIGLFGGSFNPPHEGHRHASLMALKRLGLDQVWWLVTPQNPLKPAHGTPPLAARMAQARAVARHPRIKVTDLEARLGTRYTADTLSALKARFPGVRFVFIIGADNLLDLPRWQRWTHIMDTMPLAVIARPGYGRPALAGRAARRYLRARWPEACARRLPGARPPAWVFLFGKLDPTSSTRHRAGR